MAAVAVCSAPRDRASACAPGPTFGISSSCGLGRLHTRGRIGRYAPEQLATADELLNVLDLG